MSNNGGKGFLLKINIYRSTNNAAIFASEKRNLEGKESVYPEGTAFKKSENTTTKKM